MDSIEEIKAMGINTEGLREQIEKSNRIKNNELSEDELVECLDDKRMYITSNTIIKILEMRISNDVVIDKLEQLSAYIGERFAYSKNGVAVGHFAIAALLVMNTEASMKKYLQLIKKVGSRDDVKKVEQAAIALLNLVAENRASK